MADIREKLIEILRKTRYEYRRYIAMKDYEKRMAKTDEEFLAVDDSIVGEIPFCADYLIAHGVTVQEWIPVTERLPEEGETVLIFGYWHEKFQPLMCYLSPHRKGEWFTSVAGQQVYTVTHWMPLPEPPKGEMSMEVQM